MDILYNVFEIIACILPPLFLFMFADCFLLAKTNIRYLFAALLSGFSIALTYPAKPVINNTIGSFAFMFLAVIAISFLYNGKIFIKVSLVLLYNALDIVIATCISAIFSCFSSSEISVINVSSSTVRTYYLLTTFLIEFIILYYLKRINRYSFSNTSSELYISLIFFSCDFMVILGTYFLYTQISPYKNNIAIVCCSICIFMLVCTGFVLALLHHLEEKNQELLSHEILQTQIEEQKKFIQNQHQQSQLTSYLRHDLKNLLLNYQLLLEQNNIDAVEKDISNRIGDFSATSTTIYSRNAILDSLLHSKIDNCKDLKIHFSIHADMPSDYDKLDLFVIISNLIDNAIEAESRINIDHREICVNTYKEENQIGFIIRNRIEDSVLENNPSFKTKKPDSNIHGIGLQSVRYFVEKNNGLISFFEEDEYFGVHIIMNI